LYGGIRAIAAMPACRVRTVRTVFGLPPFNRLPEDSAITPASCIKSACLSISVI